MQQECFPPLSHEPLKVIHQTAWRVSNHRLGTTDLECFRVLCFKVLLWDLQILKTKFEQFPDDLNILFYNVKRVIDSSMQLFGNFSFHFLPSPLILLSSSLFYFPFILFSPLGSPWFQTTLVFVSFSLLVTPLLSVSFCPLISSLLSFILHLGPSPC